MTIECSEKLIAYCGLYCGACPRHLKGKCPGCHTTTGSNWCKVKPCNSEHGYNGCFECTKFPNVADCTPFNPMIIRLGEWLSHTSRKACIDRIKEQGQTAFTQYMSEQRWVSIKK